MKRATSTACGLFLTAVLMGPAAGQMPGEMPNRHLVRIGFGGGFSVPTKHAADALENGVNGQAFLLFDTGVLPPLRFNLGYQRFDFKDAITEGATAQSSILSGVAGLRIDLLKLGPVRPYITGGVGAFHLTDDLDEVNGPPAEETSRSTTRFGIDGGGGIALRFGRLEAFIEGRIQNVYTERGAIDAKSIQSVPVTFGILF
jgi:hypothetical protein